MAADSKFSSTESELLQMVFEYFKKGGNWPFSRVIHVKFLDTADFWHVAGEIGGAYIRPGEKHRKDSQAILTIEGIAKCNGSKEFTSLFVASLQFCVQYYLDNPEDPKISSSELKNKLELNDWQCALVLILFRNESHIWSGIEQANDIAEFTIEISPDILRFKGVRKVSDYLEILQADRMEYEAVLGDLDFSKSLAQSESHSIFNSKLKTDVPYIMNDPNLKDIALQDIEEIEIALYSESWKSVCLLCGSLTEAILIDALQQNDSALGDSVLSKKALSLKNLIDLAIQKKIIPKRVEKMLEVIRETRNLIHANLAKSDGRIDRTTAEASYKLMEAIIAALEKWRNKKLKNH